MHPVGLSVVRIPALDGLRGIAIGLVLLHMFHVPQPAGVDGGLFGHMLETVMGTGWVGVQLFFVLSGYLITGQLLDSQGANNYFSGFFARRILRIFPLYYGILFLAFVVRPLISSISEHDAANQVWLWTFLYNWVHPFDHYVTGFTHFWSLAVEEQFYLLWPFVVWRRSVRQVLGICIAIFCATLIVRIGLRLQGVNPQAIYVFTVCRMDALAAGAAISALVRMSGGEGSSTRYPNALVAGLACLSVAVVLLPRFDQNSLFMQTAGMSLLSIGFAAIIFLVCQQSSAARGLSAGLGVWPLRMLGRYSFGLYVFHQPLDYFLLRHLVPYVPWAHSGLLPALYLLMATIVTLIVSAVSFHLYENPIMQLKSRLGISRAGRQATQGS
jgi:peptidoglycan/LPS O-acetylase OafA/YrhL